MEKKKTKDEIYEEMGMKLIEKKKVQFRCQFCSSEDVEMRQLQTRSADEGITTFMRCNSCGKMKRV